MENYIKISACLGVLNYKIMRTKGGVCLLMCELCNLYHELCNTFRTDPTYISQH